MFRSVDVGHQMFRPFSESLVCGGLSNTKKMGIRTDRESVQGVRTEKRRRLSGEGEHEREEGISLGLGGWAALHPEIPRMSARGRGRAEGESHARSWGQESLGLRFSAGLHGCVTRERHCPFVGSWLEPSCLKGLLLAQSVVGSSTSNSEPPTGRHGSETHSEYPSLWLEQGPCAHCTDEQTGSQTEKCPTFLWQGLVPKPFHGIHSPFK